MNLIDVIKSRHSVRQFKPDPVPENIIMEMLDAARHAPSGGNAQTHCFGVITDKDLIVKLADAAGGQMWIAEAPVVFACCADISWDMAAVPEDDFGLEVNRLRFGDELIKYLNDYKDRKAVCTLFQNAAPLIPAEHIFLVAAAHGLSGCFVGYLDVKKASEILKLPSDMVCLFLLPVGYPAVESPGKEKKAISEISFFNLFGDAWLSELLKSWDISKPCKLSEVDVIKYENRKPNVWIVNEKYVLKRFTNLDYMTRGIEITKALIREGVPVAIPIKTQAEKDYCSKDNEYFCLYPKIAGKGLIKHFEGDYLNRAKYLGRIIGNLHRAFVKCESAILYQESNLLDEILNWAIPASLEFSEKRGVIIGDEIITNYKNEFEHIYRELPHQIIHRDIHGENLLFENEKFTGYVDFDLSQRNVRVFDPCYMSTGILAGCFEDTEKHAQWIEVYKSIIEGYDSVCTLYREEKRALIYVLYSIQFIFIAYFAGNGYPQLAESNIKMLNWVYENRNRLEVL